MRDDLRIMRFLMRLDAKVERLISHLEIDDGREEQET
jgi:hypothetical protein